MLQVYLHISTLHDFQRVYINTYKEMSRVFKQIVIHKMIGTSQIDFKVCIEYVWLASSDN